MPDMESILLVYSVQWFGPATPHWAIYYINAIVHDLNQDVKYVKIRLYALSGMDMFTGLLNAWVCYDLS